MNGKRMCSIVVHMMPNMEVLSKLSSLKKTLTREEMRAELETAGFLSTIACFM